MDSVMTEAQHQPIEVDPATKESNDAETQVEKTLSTNAMPLSKRLEEVVALMQSINQRLENLSVERRAQVSQAQWTTLEEFKASAKTGLKPAKFWQKSLFARTYFVDKDLDESFHNVMKHSTLFSSHLSSLNGKLQIRGEGSAEDTCGPDNISAVAQQIKTLETAISTKEQPPVPPIAVPSGSSSSQNTSAAAAANATAETPSDDSEEAASGNLKVIRQSFTKLIRAKIEFDSQFLNFNATLSKNCYSEDFHCLYKICANSNVILGRQTSLSADKKLKRKRLSTGGVVERAKKTTTTGLRRSSRIAVENDPSAEVQVIRCLKR